MIYENVELTGSLQVTGSIIVPMGGDSGRTNITGSLFFNTQSNALEIFTGESGSDWVDVFGSGSGGGGGAADTSVEYLVVAGGGGGGLDMGGGGGAGGLLSSSFASLTSGSSYTITVGSGGTGWTNISNRNNQAGDGGDSSISGTGITTVTATGGGGAGSGQNIDGRDGGSGGGGSSDGNYVTVGGSGTTGQGNDGGGEPAGNRNGGAGGGGAAAAGSDSPGNNNGGAGGDGKQSSITGTSTYYAGGGGGGAYLSSNSGGTGGQGGGADGGTGDGGNGTANTGGGAGGGAGSGPGAGGNGGSGVVILAYDSGSVHGAGGISGDAGNARRYHQFNSSDSFVMGAVGDFDVVTDNLSLHLDAGDYSSRNSTTQWDDISGNDLDVTLVSNPTLGQNWYYEFDGSNNYGTITHNNLLTASAAFSIEAWVNRDDNGEGYIFVKSGGSGAYGYYFQFHNNSDWGYTLATYNTSNTRFTANSTIANSGTIGEWQHVVGTFDNSNVRIYVDGTLHDTTAFTGTIAPNTTGAVVGAYVAPGYGNKFDGKIAQIRFYQKTLSADEITQNYNATKTNFV